MNIPNDTLTFEKRIDIPAQTFETNIPVEKWQREIRQRFNTVCDMQLQAAGPDCWYAVAKVQGELVEEVKQAFPHVHTLKLTQAEYDALMQDTRLKPAA